MPAMKRTLLNRCVAIALVVLPFLLANGSGAVSQRNTNPTNKELPLKELLKLPGKLVSETKNARASGDLRVTGYRVEELQLPRNITAEIKGQQVAVDKAWRVTINGGPFPVRALPAVVWIDDEIVGNGIENETLTQITAITLDSSLIHEGGVVSISYGQNKEDRMRISEPLQLKRRGENQ
jgi:hypothetical protein